METVKADVAYYMKCLDVFHSKDTERDATEHWIRQHVTSLVKEAFNESKREPLRILSVGCGTGQPDCVILDQLLFTLDNVHIYYNAVEPNQEYLAECKTIVVDNPKYRRVAFDVHHETSGEFLKREKAGKFHLVHFFQSLYFLNLEETFKGYRQLLQPQGVILSVIENGDQGLTKLYTEYKHELQKVIKSHEFMTSADVDLALNELGYQYKKCQFKSRFDASCIFAEDEEGDLLLSFITFIKDFRQKAPVQLVQKYLKSLKEMTSKEAEANMIFQVYDVNIVTCRK